MSSHEPRLPPELEREIFDILALVEPRSIPQLILVAQRVKIWVQQYLYPVIILSSTKFERAYAFHDSPPLSRFSRISPTILGSAVHHLFLDGLNSHRAHSALSTCKAVRDLWINCGHPSLLDIAGELPLQRLYCDPLLFFGSQGNIDFGHALFSQITHLELFFDAYAHNQEVITSVWNGLAAIPHLTHLAFSERHFLLGLAPHVLQTSSSLRVLVFFPENSYPLGAGLPSTLHLSTDLRFVQIRMSHAFSFGHDWERGALGGNDYWTEAEALVERRRNGQIPASHSILRAFVTVPESSNESGGEVIWVTG